MEIVAALVILKFQERHIEEEEAHDRFNPGTIHTAEHYRANGGLLRRVRKHFPLPQCQRTHHSDSRPRQDRSGPSVRTGRKSRGWTKPYPQLVQALGDHPIIYRGGEYNALDNPKVRKAVEATGRKSLAVAGISTDGCVIETALGALRLGYRVALVEDATAGLTRETHDIAVRRMIQAGVVPVSWLSLATEFQMNWEKKDTAQAYFSLIAEASPGLTMSIQAEHAAAEGTAVH